MPLHHTPASTPETTPLDREFSAEDNAPLTRRARRAQQATESNGTADRAPQVLDQAEDSATSVPLTRREVRERRIRSLTVDMSALNGDGTPPAATDPSVHSEGEQPTLAALPLIEDDTRAFTPPRVPSTPVAARPSPTARAPKNRSNGGSALREVLSPRKRASGGRQSIRGTIIAALLVPGIFGTVALPAFSLPDTTADANAQLTQGEQQSIVVSADAQASALNRDGYSATTASEIASARAATGYAYESTSSLAAYNGPSAQGWWRPLPGEITSPYGPRSLICNGAGCSNSFHEGIDFGNDCGTPIRAANAGTVVFVGNAGAYGNRVIIDHGGGIETVYGHLLSGSYKVAVGDVVAGGTEIADVGATGVVSGCHLDLKVTIDGKTTDPAPFLIERGVPV